MAGGPSQVSPRNKDLLLAKVADSFSVSLSRFFVFLSVQRVKVGISMVSMDP
jgi:hypothetical protein